MIGVRADGTKKLIALDDGHRESIEPWRTCLAAANTAGCPLRPHDQGRSAGILGRHPRRLPDHRERRYLFHRIVNALNALPTSAKPIARKAPAEIWQVQDRAHAVTAAMSFAEEYGAK